MLLQEKCSVEEKRKDDDSSRLIMQLVVLIIYDLCCLKPRLRSTLGYYVEEMKESQTEINLSARFAPHFPFTSPLTRPAYLCHHTKPLYIIIV